MHLTSPFLSSILLVAGILLAPGAVAQANSWTIDTSHSVANFKVKHMMVTNVFGSISGIKGKVVFDEQNPAKSQVSATLDTATINTADAKRDEHLRSPDFLNAAKHPELKFESKSVTKEGDKLKVLGALTVNGVTKDVTLDVEGPTAPVKGMKGELRRGVSATTKFNRKDFGVVWNKNLDGGGLVVGDEIAVELSLELIDGSKASH